MGRLLELYPLKVEIDDAARQLTSRSSVARMRGKCSRALIGIGHPTMWPAAWS